MDDTKRSHIRGYILALIGEGTFEGAQTPMETIARACTTFAKDVGSVMGEMTSHFAQAQAPKIQAFAVEQAFGFFDNVLKRGLKGAWEDLQTAHKRGVDANGRGK